MSFLGTLQAENQHFSHGGRRLLTLRWQRPTGDSVAAEHYRRAVELLTEHGKGVVFPDLCRQLETAVARGEGHLLPPHCYDISLHAAKLGKRGTVAVTLAVTLTAGDTVLYKRESRGHWSQDGALRLSPSRRGARM